MKNYFVVSAVGRDQPGLVNRVTHAIRDVGGNIELQRSTRMAAEFAMLALFSVDTEDPTVVIARLSELNNQDLAVSTREALSDEADRPLDARPVDLIASGADQPGIIDAVTQLLFKSHVNIESMDYDTESAPFTGEQLFTLNAQLAAPEDVDLQALRDQLRELEEQYNFDIIIR